MTTKSVSLNLSILSVLFISPNANLILKCIVSCIGLALFSGIAAVFYSVISPPDYQSSLGLNLLFIGLLMSGLCYVFLYLYGDDL